jgi:hypothetical protein
MLRGFRSATVRSLSGLVRRLRADHVLRCLLARGGRCIRRAASRAGREALAGRVAGRALLQVGRVLGLVHGLDSVRARVDRERLDCCLLHRVSCRARVRAVEPSSVAADSVTKRRRKAR